MNQKGHLLSFFLALLCILFVFPIQYKFEFACVSFFFAIFLTPDLDKHFTWLGHRSMITHSILLPILCYWIFHPYVNMLTAKEFGIALLLPTLIHLCCDLGGVKGFGLIRLYKVVCNVITSYIWLLVNIVYMFLFLWMVL